MEQQVILGALAIGVGFAAAVALFVPFVVVSYRVRGRLSATRLFVWFAALVYFWAIWSYTLLPLPSPETITCAGTNLDPLRFVDDVRGALGPPRATLTDPAVLQLALNVLLFVPLGFFIRLLGNRGIPTAAVVGLCVSAVIETTQLTGVWGLYPCAYRVFDVDDLLMNTLGAVCGSVIAVLIPRERRGIRTHVEAVMPREVTRGRRLLAMLCDGLGLLLFAAAVTIALRAGLLYVLDDREAALGETPTTLGMLSACAVWLLLILGTGRSVGDVAVQLRYTGSVFPTPVTRTLRAVTGVVGFGVLMLAPGPGTAAAWAFVLLSVIATLTTDRGRGLPGVLSRQRVTDARREAWRGAAPSSDLRR
ncbi:VanZ family protein [Nesterenkonia sp. CL21]|uniref:VanZ family protein n=1 Tax=unclassified Nesterenkonia TaxID=2629769 RepID=UPI002879AA8B|nr:VanZ family protein [Nesterenkonia sp. CL21]MDS2171782.1 VanZ family protein [Nesterenkonia sp. CL21]